MNAGEARGRRYADHRRHQDQRRRGRQRGVFERVERVLRDQRAAVRVADEHQRAIGADDLPDVARPHAHGGDPVFPGWGHQPTGHGPVALHAQRERVVATGVQPGGQGAHAVRRIREAVNQQCAAAQVGGLEDLRPVPIDTQLVRVAAAAGYVAVRHRRIGGRRDHGVDALAGLEEHGIFAPEIVLDRERVGDLGGARFEARHEHVPGLEVRQAVNRTTSPADRQQGRGERHGQEAAEQPGFHATPSPRARPRSRTRDDRFGNSRLFSSLLT